MNDRVAIVTEPALPASCCACGTLSDGTKKFADTGTSIDYFGAVLLCENCIVEISRKFETPVAEAEGRIQELVENLEEVTNELDHYKFVFSSLSIIRPDLGLPEPVSSKGDESGSEKDESGFDESATGGGLENVSEPPD